MNALSADLAATALRPLAAKPMLKREHRGLIRRSHKARQFSKLHRSSEALNDGTQASPSGHATNRNHPSSTNVPHPEV